MNRAIITGPTGVIGTALLQHLVDRGVECLVILRAGSARAQNIPLSPLISTVYCSLDELCHLQNDKNQNYDVFYHLAWEGTSGNMRQDVRLQSRNMAFALDAVECAKRFGCQTFIGVGSQAEYGRVEGSLRTDTPVFPENAYGVAKMCAGQMTRLLAAQLGLKHIWVRVLSIYGPNDSAQSMVSSTINKLLCGQTAEFTKGEQQWDYLYSADAAKALFLLGSKGQNGKTYVLGSGEARPLSEYIQIIAKKLDAEDKIRIGALPYSENQVMNLCADISELTKDTGWKPETTFERGIEMTIKHIERGGGNN